MIIDTHTYRPDECRDPVDVFILAQSLPEPQFDTVLRDFLLVSNADLKARLSTGTTLVEAASLGQRVPWLYRLTYRTHGLVRTGAGEVQPHDEHTIALRFQPDYLRRAQQFEMLQYVAPRDPAPFHPNICPRTGAICVEVYPGEPLLEIVHSLHDLLRWRLRQLAEQDALNQEACCYGRNRVTVPIDERPLFGRRWKLEFEPREDPR